MTHPIPMTAPVQELIHQIETEITGNTPMVIAIDGRCGSGKTTLAALLQTHFSAVVIHADDFFLRPEQRIPTRFAEPGGNMDRERLLAEVLIPLREHRNFSYRPFDCHTLSLGTPIEVTLAPLIIVEGSYTCHPELWDFYRRVNAFYSENKRNPDKCHDQGHGFSRKEYKLPAQIRNDNGRNCVYRHCSDS